jgi:hypothetical protein
MTLQPPPLPREHGAWAMLAIPLLVGLSASGRPVVSAVLILPAMLLLFLARYAALPLVGLDRALWGEMIGLTGLACSAALVMAAAGQPLDGRTWSTTALCLGYFVTSVASVRTYRASADAKTNAAILCVAAHVAVLAGLAVLWREGWLPGLAMLAFVPVVMRTAWGLWRPPLNVRKMGWTEMGVASSLLLVATLAYAI